MSLFKRNRPDPRTADRAAALTSWASAHGRQYVDTFPPTRSVLLARAERNQIYDLVTGPLVAGLDCQLFTFDWVTVIVDNYGGRSYKHHPSIAIRAVFPSALALRYVSVEPAHEGALGHARDKLFGIRHHNARELQVPGLEGRFHVWSLEQDDEELVEQLLSPSVAAMIAQPPAPDRYPLSFQFSGAEAMVTAAGVTLEPEYTDAAEWLVTRAAPFLAEMGRAAAAGPAPATPFAGPLVEPERAGDTAPAPSAGKTSTVTTTVRRNFRINVPSQYAAKAQSALQEWLAGRGHPVTISAAPNGDQTTLTFSSDDASAPDLSDPAIQGELQKVLMDALTGKA